MPLMGFQKKKKNWIGGWGGWVELYPNYFWIFGIFLTLQSPLGIRLRHYVIVVYKGMFDLLGPDKKYPVGRQWFRMKDEHC